MGRSVSYANGSIAIAYTTLDIEGEDFFESTFLDDTIEDVQEYAPTLWPSFLKCDKWLGREDHAVLENSLAYIGVSEYCGLVSIWLAPKDEPFAENFCSQIKEKFLKTFGTLNKVATFSNGEAMFEKVQK